jgi:hypothetical protein
LADQVSHPYKRTDKIKAMYIVDVNFLTANGTAKCYAPMAAGIA